MTMILSRCTLGLTLILSAATSQADICDDLAQQAERWDLIGYNLDDLVQSDMTAQEAAQINDAIELESADSRQMARLLVAENAYLEQTYGEPLHAALTQLKQAQDWDVTFEAMAKIYTLTQAAADECHGNEPDNETIEPVGRFIVSYAAPPSDQMSAENVAYFEKMINTLRTTGDFQATADMVSYSLRLPHDVPVTFDFCGVANAFYDPTTSSITMCYEYFTEIIVTFIDNDISGPELDSAVNGVGNYVLLHEIGHALVDLLEIPITGREEDSADSLASLIMIQSGSVDALSAAMVNYGIMADLTAEATEGQYAFHDEHSLNAQRMFDMMCMIYGSDPKSYADIVGDDALPKARADRCPYEYIQKDRAWDTLLGPHFLQ